MSTEQDTGSETELDRRALLAEAQIYGVDLFAISTQHPNGMQTVDWDVLKQAVAEVRPPHVSEPIP